MCKLAIREGDEAISLVPLRSPLIKQVLVCVVFGTQAE
jgi:hypothetical protein